MAASIDLAELQTWVGRTEEAEDWITPQMTRGLRAVLDQDPGEPQPGDPAPSGIHWCLAPPTAPMSALGQDGHPARGGFLPPVPLPRRMWAGGELEFLDRLLVGDRVLRRSRIESVELKQGRSGALCFVAVRHELSTGRGAAIRERHDIVYRQAAPPAAPASATPPAALPEAEASRTVQASPVLLFRYSALTFNGHRIHYDRRYCQEEEHYPGLVVHGPLQATLLLDLVRSLSDGRPLRSFRFRGVHPLFDGAPFSVNGRHSGAQRLELWVADAAGRQAMAAEATLA